MKNLLSENMLRFGTKNLSEASLRKLLNELKDPVTAAANVKKDMKNAAGQVVKSVTGTEYTATYLAPTTAVTKDKTGKETKTLTTATGKITCMIYQDNNVWKTTALAIQGPEKTAYLIADSSTNKFNFSASTGGTPVKMSLSYTGPGNNPYNAVIAVIAEVSKGTGKTYSLDPAADTALKDAFSNNYKTTTTVTTDRTTKSFPNVTFTMTVYKDPETDKAIADQQRLITGAGLRLEIPATGAYTVTGNESITGAGMSFSYLAQQLAKAEGNKQGSIIGTNSTGTNYERLKADMQTVVNGLVV